MPARSAAAVPAARASSLRFSVDLVFHIFPIRTLEFFRVQWYILFYHLENKYPKIPEPVRCYHENFRPCDQKC